MDEFLRAQMRERGWKVAQLAEECQVNPGLAARWVTRNPRYRVRPSPASCAKIAAALGIDPDYVLELAHHRKPRPGQPEGDPVQSELDTRFARLATTLSKYPRAVWLAVVEANERMADALAYQGEPPISDPKQGRVSATRLPRTRRNSAHNGELPGSSSYAEPMAA